MKNIAVLITALTAAAVFLISTPLQELKAKASAGSTTVTLQEGEENALANFYTLKNALNGAQGEELKIKIETPGRYYIDTTGQALRIESYTTLDLNGATLIRYGAMTNQNFFQNADTDDKRETGGYALTKNISIKNGTLDGNAAAASRSVNMLNFGHADGITLDSLNIKNVLDGHLIEFSGCRNVTVKGCTFEGFYGETSGINEAIQIDICKNTWNGVYKTDGTVCSDMTITGCTFKDFPTGVGNHHTLTGGNHCKNIKITSNKFLNTKKYSTPGAAVWCYGFDNTTVKGNTISGLYSEGIKISGGYADVTSNIIDLKKTADSSGIYITHASSYDCENETPSTRSDEYVKSGSISGNTISGYGRNGISVNSYSVLDTISSNTVKGAKGSGIFVTRSTIKSGINSNTVTGCTRIDADNEGHGIHITSTSKAGKITGNTVKSCKGYGIVNYSTLIAVDASGNTLSGNLLGDKLIKAEAPAKVKNFKAGGNTASSVKLSWTKVSGAEGYVIYRYDNTAKSYKRIAKQKENSYCDKSLKAGGSYRYAVRAYKTVAGREILSSSYPTLDTYTQIKLTSANGAGTIRLSWTKVSGISGYIVYRYDSKANSGKGGWKVIAKPRTNTYTDTGLKPGTTYKYAVKHFRTVSGKTVISQNKYPILTTSTKPAKVTFTAAAASKGIKLSWKKVTGAGNYIVYYRLKGETKWNSIKAANTAASKSISGLKSRKNYEVTVKAVRTVNGINYSGTYTVKTLKTK